MAQRTAIIPAGAPAPVGPYSPGLACGGLLFVSGQLPVDPATGVFVEGDMGARARQCLRNVQAVAQAAGADLDQVVKVTVFLTDLADFAAMNAAYAEFFAAPFPARSTIQVAALPLGSNIEIEAVIDLP
ncbi:Rid family detoxifying hydrolase [Nitratidesulfovibrio sp. D1]|uniref:Rid family detoxifying hydrolase n=1 Tax=Nitratidesulfovibrio sp. D1 TaxID=3440151 RepID=UPI003EB9E447